MKTRQPIFSSAYGGALLRRPADRDQLPFPAVSLNTLRRVRVLRLLRSQTQPCSSRQLLQFWSPTLRRDYIPNQFGNAKETNGT